SPQRSRPAIIFQFVRRTDDRADAASREMISQQNEFIRCRQIFPIHDRDVWHAVAVPFAVNRQQRVEQSFHRRELLQIVALRRTDIAGSSNRIGFSPSWSESLDGFSALYSTNLIS